MKWLLKSATREFNRKSRNNIRKEDSNSPHKWRLTTASNYSKITARRAKYIWALKLSCEFSSTTCPGSWFHSLMACEKRMFCTMFFWCVAWCLLEISGSTRVRLCCLCRRNVNSIVYYSIHRNNLTRIPLAREFRLYMDFDILTGPLQPENSYV